MKILFEDLVSVGVLEKIERKQIPEISMQDLEKYELKAEEYLKKRNHNMIIVKFKIGSSQIEKFLKETKGLFRLYSTPKGNGIQLIDSTMGDLVRLMYINHINPKLLEALRADEVLSEIL